MTRNHIRIVVLLVAALGAIAPPAAAQTGTVMPTPFQTVLDNNGLKVNNACVWTYTAGTTSQVNTYTDVALTSANTNPIRSDAAGRFTAFLTPGASYKFVYEAACVPPAHGSVYRTADNVVGVPAGAASVDVTGTAGETIAAGKAVYLSLGDAGKTAGQWFLADATNTYSSITDVVGLAPAAIASGASGTIRLAGQVAGLSSLTTGQVYYVATTAGSLIASPPTNKRVLGYADSTASLVLVRAPGQGELTNSTSLITPVLTGSVTGTYALQGSPSVFNVVTTTSTGAQNNFNPGIVGNTVIFCNNASALTITGLAPTIAAYDGQMVLIRGTNSQVNLTHQSASSTAGNRLVNTVTIGDTPFTADGHALYVYDATNSRWRLVTHEQGSWITPTFAAGDYTTNGAGGITVASGDRAYAKYFLRGRQLTYITKLNTVTVTAATGNALRIAIPGGFSSVSYGDFLHAGTCRYTDNGGTATTGRIEASSFSLTVVDVFKTDESVWTASADNTSLACQYAIEVQ